MTESTRAPRNAFTLVELLVVIGIIAVLISVLLPALNRARAQAQGAACLSNMRQCGIALRMYANDYRDWLPATRSGQLINGAEVRLRPTETWPDALMERKYLGDIRSRIARRPDGSIAESLVPWPNVFSCPSLAPQLGFTGPTGQAYGNDDATTRFSFGLRIEQNDFKRSNGNVERWYRLDGSALASGSTVGGVVTKLGQISNSVPVMADSIIQSSFNRFSQCDSIYTKNPSGFNNYINRRHNNSANCLFSDGSARPMARKELRAIRTVQQVANNEPGIYSFPDK